MINLYDYTGNDQKEKAIVYSENNELHTVSQQHNKKTPNQLIFNKTFEFKIK